MTFPTNPSLQPVHYVLTRMVVTLAFPLFVMSMLVVAVINTATESSDVLAFAIQSETGADIVLIDSHTLEQRTLASSAGGEGYLNWLPDGSALIYADGQHIYRLSVDSGENQQLTRGSQALHSAPSLSPDGRTIAYLRSRGFFPEIWIMNADGRSPRALSSSTIYGGRPPAWSPDGEQIGVIVNGPESSDAAIITVKRNSLINLTQDAHLNDDIAWSPDGQRVGYISAGANGTGYELDVRDLTTATVRTIANNAAFVGRASWSPDGRQLVFIMREPRGEYYLYRMDWPDGKLYRLVQEKVSPSWINWSPDGSRLALVAIDRAGLQVAQIVDVRLRLMMPIAHGSALYLNPPVWRPIPARTQVVD